VKRPPHPANGGIFSFANGCFALGAAPSDSAETTYLAVPDRGNTVVFSAADAEAGAAFLLRPADLGTYLLYDHQQGYLVPGPQRNGPAAFRRRAALPTEEAVAGESARSVGEWDLEVSHHDGRYFQLRHGPTGHYVTLSGLHPDVAEAAVLTLSAREGCASFPELTVDAEGQVEPRTWDDGVFGIVDAHAHLFTNVAFGGSGIFHGAPYHRLGVEHALGSCANVHGEGGLRDVVGYLHDNTIDLSSTVLLDILLRGTTPDFYHHTEGYPDFTYWPNARKSATHQTMYYRWLERAYLAGLRLLVQHGTSNSVLCEYATAVGIQQARYSCNDMVAVDRTIDEVYNLERYIDAQWGGPGLGWFRIVRSPAQARQVINDGKLAVLLGIEVSNLFDCFLSPREGFPPCDMDHVRHQLDHYYERGVRAIFPVHKYDNAFSAGDGNRGFIELGNFINSGHYSNFSDDCPDIRAVFDNGGVSLGGLNRPRGDYLAEAVVDMSDFAVQPLSALIPFWEELQEPSVQGQYCQNAGLTVLGEQLLGELMLRGMIIEIDHFPRRALERLYELFFELDYPVAATHGNHNDGRVHELGGLSVTDLGRCADPDRPGAMAGMLTSRVELIRERGGYPAEGFGFDLNGFTSQPRPRFGDESQCRHHQEHPITYPFSSFAGDVTFHQPRLGHRTVDFNTEGMIHIGLLPEVIEDARRTGATDQQLEPLFRSAEAYLRMWERSEERAAALAEELAANLSGR
jgi:microsomal dipeptidase-like Zn-dependent dipeptidase